MKRNLLLLMLFTTFGATAFGQSNLFVNDTLITPKNQSSCWSVLSSATQGEGDLSNICSIDRAEVKDSCLELTIAYGGGCGNAYLRLVPTFKTEGTHSTLTLTPLLLDNDSCKAMIFKDVRFSLASLKKRYPLPFTLKVGRFETVIK